MEQGRRLSSCKEVNETRRYLELAERITLKGDRWVEAAGVVEVTTTLLKSQRLLKFIRGTGGRRRSPKSRLHPLDLYPPLVIWTALPKPSPTTPSFSRPERCPQLNRLDSAPYCSSSERCSQKVRESLASITVAYFWSRRGIL